MALKAVCVAVSPERGSDGPFMPPGLFRVCPRSCPEICLGRRMGSLREGGGRRHRCFRPATPAGVMDPAPIVRPSHRSRCQHFVVRWVGFVGTSQSCLGHRPARLREHQHHFNRIWSARSSNTHSKRPPLGRCSWAPAGKGGGRAQKGSPRLPLPRRPLPPDPPKTGQEKSRGGPRDPPPGAARRGPQEA